MDPTLLTLDDKSRAPRGKIRSPEFSRLLRLVWPHRRFILIGFIASVVYGFLNSVSVMGMLPVLHVMLKDEGLHGWIDRTVAEQRLGFAWSAENGAVVVSSTEDVGDNEHIRVLDQLDTYRFDETGEQPVADIATFLQAVTLAADDAEMFITVQRGGESVEAVLPLSAASLEWRLAHWAADWVPREKQRRDRVGTLAYVLGAVVFIVLLSNVARFTAEYFVALGTLRGVMDLRRQLYRKILRLPMSFFSREVSDLVSRFVADAQEIQRGLLALFGKTLREPLRALFLFAWALWLNVEITLALCVAAPVVVFIFWAVGRRIRKANKRLLESYGLMVGALTTTLQAIGVVKAYGAENIERRRLWRIDRKMFGQLVRLVKLEAILRPLLETLAVVGIAVLTVWLGAQVVEGQIELADFAQLILVLAMVLDPLRKLADVYPRVMRSAAGASRTFAVLDAPEEAELAQGAVEVGPLRNRIEFRDVTFTYPEASEPALRDVNLSIAQGETVALVGANGSGKTTLTKLITRFYDPQAGQILYDGVDVRSAALRSLRRQIATVSQDPVVFAMTIAENIAYGTRHADAERVEEAARQAHAESFIREKQHGYDEPVGERGGTLSGGQRQRLCIARAVMRNAPVLIFDEATSQIDSESEGQIQDAIRDYATGRTTILIAHRLSTIRFAQRVVVLDRGAVVDTGSHEELLARCPIYAAICRTQLSE